jgi:hypothetical protein
LETFSGHDLRMVYEGNPRNAFRSTVLGDGPASPIVEKKRAKRDSSSEGLKAVGLARSEHRRSNQRSGDREVRGTETVIVRKGRHSMPMGLVNLSGGGAMVEGDLKARLWDKVTLVLGVHGEVECAVRWIRDERFGLEFAHETRIDCEPALRDETLRQAIQDNFTSDEVDAAQSSLETVDDKAGKRRAARHPMIWSGMIHSRHDSVVARLRNVSAGGAQIQTTGQFEPGMEVVLDLGNAGAVAALVSWSCGDQTGLAFVEEFDVRRLAACKPVIAERKWAKPDYLRDESTESSPWASEWGRLTLKELSRTLAG